MKKKIVLLLTTSLLSGIALSACGGSGRDPYANLDFDEDIRGAKITMWTPFGSDMHAQVEYLVNRWSEKTGVQVVVEAKSGYDTLKSAISESASTETYPNITFAYPDHMASYVGSDILLRLDTYFEKGSSTKFDYAPENDVFAISDFYANYMDENQSVEFKEDGSGYTLGVPFNKSTEVLTYNTTFFDWAKTKDEGIFVPTTWDEVDIVCDKILAVMENNDVYGHFIGKDGKTYDTNEEVIAATDDDALFDFSQVIDPKKATDANRTFAFRPLARDSQANFFITTVRQYGGEYSSLDKATRKGKILFDSTEAKAGLKAMQDRYNANRIGIPQSWGEAKYSSNPFSALKCVMTVGSSAGADSNAPKGGKFDVSCAPVPFKDESNKYVISQGTNLILLDKGSNAERIASWELLKYLTKYANGEFSKKTGYFPSCDFAFQSEEYQGFFNENPKAMDAKINLAAAKVNRDVYTAPNTTWVKFVDAAFDGSSTVRTAVDTAMPLLFIGKNGRQYTPDEIVAQLYNSLSDYQ